MQKKLHFAFSYMHNFYLQVYINLHPSNKKTKKFIKQLSDKFELYIYVKREYDFGEYEIGLNDF